MIIENRVEKKEVDLSLPTVQSLYPIFKWILQSIKKNTLTLKMTQRKKTHTHKSVNSLLMSMGNGA